MIRLGYDLLLRIDRYHYRPDYNEAWSNPHGIFDRYKRDIDSPYLSRRALLLSLLVASSALLALPVHARRLLRDQQPRRTALPPRTSGQ